MNTVPKEAIRVSPQRLQEFVSAVFRNVGLSSEDADLLAHLLTLTDLRGVSNHGTVQIATYIRQFRKGQLNPRPDVRLISESSTILIADGDGGLGYFPAYRAVHALIDKALAQGVAVALPRNHGHIGAAGLYSRIPMEHDLICYGVSGHQMFLEPGSSIVNAAGGSPMTFAIPAGKEPPLVLDFGTMKHLYGGPERIRDLIEAAPGLVLRSMGLGNVCQALGGLLAGLSARSERHEAIQGIPFIGPAKGRFPGANQGALFIALDISRFMPVEDFKREMDEYVRQVRQMEPLPGYEWAGLPGGLEWERERERRESGGPRGKAHRETWEKIGEEAGVSCPF